MVSPPILLLSTQQFAKTLMAVCLLAYVALPAPHLKADYTLDSMRVQ